MPSFLKKEYGLPKLVVEVAYNILDGCKRYRYDADLELFMQVCVKYAKYPRLGYKARHNKDTVHTFLIIECFICKFLSISYYYDADWSSSCRC